MRNDKANPNAAEKMNMRMYSWCPSDKNDRGLANASCSSALPLIDSRHTGVTSRHRSKRTDKVITASITTDAQNDGAGDTVVTSVATSTAHATPIEVRWGESAWANAMPMR